MNRKHLQRNERNVDQYNPILKGFYPDPSIIRVENEYFMVCSSFTYFPGIPVFRSENLTDWEQIGYCLTRTSQLELNHSLPNQGIYAPTIRYDRGVFYVLSTNVTTGKNFYVTAQSPYGEWSDPVYVEADGIDPSLFFDDDGSAYFTVNPCIDGRRGIWCARIDLQTGTLLEELQFLWQGTGKMAPEGAHIYKRDNWYYLMIAEGGTQFGHCETIARSRNVYGPYEQYEKNPILCNAGKDSLVQGVGHADLVTDTEGNWWAVFLGSRFYNIIFNPLGRETFLGKVEWVNDWPVINENQTVYANTSKKYTVVYDTFHELGYEWNYIRNPMKENYVFMRDKMILYGSDSGLDSTGHSPSFIGRRQQDIHSRFSVCFEYEPQFEEEAGITVYMSPKFHYDFVLQKKNCSSWVVLKKTIEGNCQIVNEIEYDHPGIKLIIQSDESGYVFSMQDPEGTKTTAGRLSNKYISPLCSDSKFTGMYYGIFGTCNGSNKTPVVVNKIIYEE